MYKHMHNCSIDIYTLAASYFVRIRRNRVKIQKQDNRAITSGVRCYKSAGRF